MPNRILEQYKKKIVPALRKEFGYKNISSVPKVEKVVINVGMGRSAVNKDTKLMEKIEADLAKISGQKPSLRLSKKSIAGFKLREGLPVGCVVTLRGTKMYDFIDRLISLALPRSRDFQGIPLSSVDLHGNINIGVKEHNIFPEITYESLKDIFGLEVTVVTSARTREEGIALFRLFGFPLKTS